METGNNYYKSQLEQKLSHSRFQLYSLPQNTTVEHYKGRNSRNNCDRETWKETQRNKEEIDLRTLIRTNL